MPELPVAAAECTGSVQDDVNNGPNADGQGAHQIPCLTEELLELMTDGGGEYRLSLNEAPNRLSKFQLMALHPFVHQQP